MMLLLFLLLCFSFFSCSVLCGSDGLLTFCDLNPARLNRYGHLGGTLMKWTKSPINATFYTLRSGNGPDVKKDPKVYIPGSLNPIFLDVLDYERIFIGLLMYAVNSEDDYTGKVGQFTLPPFSPFQITETCDPVGAVVSHQDAEEKPFSTMFYWTAPPGTGRVKFRILIKWGEQNKGAFFVPAGELVLNEGVPLAEAAVSGQSLYFLGSPGSSCTETCAAQLKFPYCDLTKTQAINNSVTLAEVADPLTACAYPLINGCAAVAPSQNNDGLCSFKAPPAECDPAIRNNAAPTTCEATQPDASRFCACSEFPSGAVGSSTGLSRPRAPGMSSTAAATPGAQTSTGVGIPQTPLPPNSQSFTVMLTGPAFTLDGVRSRALFVPLGSTIRFTAGATWSQIHPFVVCEGNQGVCGITKTVAPPAGTSGIKTLGSYFDFTADKLGVFSYGCGSHGYIEGATITVLPQQASDAAVTIAEQPTLFSSLSSSSMGMLWGIIGGFLFCLTIFLIFTSRRQRKRLELAKAVGQISNAENLLNHSNQKGSSGSSFSRSHRSLPSSGTRVDFLSRVNDLDERHQREHEESLEMNPIIQKFNQSDRI